MDKIKTSLDFSVYKIEFEEEKSKRFSRATVHAFADGPNAHTLPIENSVLTECANSVYDIPIICKYSRYADDFLSHEPDEVPIGFVKESSPTYSNPIVFEKQEDGRTFLVIKALIWRKYAKDAIRVLERKGKKAVSVEITITKGEEVGDKVRVDEFVLDGITVLGDFVTPAIRGANLQMEFSEDKKLYLEGLEFADKMIKIDNRKESAVDGAWSNPRRKLFNPISKASNVVSLVKEAYLVNEGSDEEPEISKLKYPHHVIRNGELVIHIGGIQAAFQRAKQQGIFSGAVKAHITRHYRELGLTMENFSEFNVSEEDAKILFSDADKKNEGVGEKDMADDIKSPEVFEQVLEEVRCEAIAEKEAAEATVKEQCAECACEEVACEEIACAEEEAKPEEEVVSQEISDEDHEEDSDDKDDENDDSDEEEKPEEMSLEMAMAKIEELSNKMAELEEENKAYMAKIEEMSDYADLKKFKEMAEAKAKQEADMAAMEKVMCDIEVRGFKMSNEDKTALMEKFSEFDSADAWANYVKAQAFDMVDNTADTIKIGLPFAKPKSESIWDKI